MKNILVIMICLLLPVGLMLLLMRKKSSIWLSFLIGMLAFVISQILLRMPLLNQLQGRLSFQFFVIRQPMLYVLLLAFSAGLFEEFARYLGFLSVKKHHNSFYDALAFGLGHGGVEAFLLVGIPLLGVNAGIQGVWLGLLERCFAMLAHVMLSVIVWYGVKEQKVRYVLLAVLVHTGLNCYPLLGTNIWIIETYLVCYVILLSVLCYQWIIKKVIKDETV